MGVFSSAAANRITIGSSQPSQPQDGDMWSDTNNAPPILKLYSSASSAFVNATGLINLRADSSFTSGEALAINELVMVDSTDNEVFVCTSAKSHQAIGVMLKSVATSTAFSFQDCATYGVVTMIAGGTILIGDRLTCDSGTAGRVIASNTIAAHSHTAFTMNGTPVAGTAATTTMNVISDGAGGIMIDADKQAGFVRTNATGAGADKLTATTSSDAAITHGKIIGKALEAATVGETCRSLLAQVNGNLREFCNICLTLN